MLSVTITSAGGRGLELKCASASQFGSTLVARWENPNTLDAAKAQRMCAAERGIVVASDFSEDGTLAVIRLTECAVDFS